MLFVLLFSVVSAAIRSSDEAPENNPFAAAPAPISDPSNPNPFAMGDARGTNASALARGAQPNDAPLKCCCAKKEPQKFICVPLPAKKGGLGFGSAPVMAGQVMHEPVTLVPEKASAWSNLSTTFERLSIPVTTRTTSVCKGAPLPEGAEAQKAAAVISKFGMAEQAQSEPAWASGGAIDSEPAWASGLADEAPGGAKAVTKLKTERKGWFGKRERPEVAAQLLETPLTQFGTLDATRKAIQGNWAQYNFRGPTGTYAKYSNAAMKELHILVNDDVVYTPSAEEIPGIDGQAVCTQWEVGVSIDQKPGTHPKRINKSKDPVHGKRPWRMELQCNRQQYCTKWEVTHACGWSAPDSTLFKRVGRMGQCMEEVKGSCPNSHYHTNPTFNGGFRFCDCGKAC